MVVAPPSLVIFADVDGILFNRAHGTVDEVDETIDLLSTCGVPLVLCSGKTRVQLERISQQLGICHPFICEYGAAVVIPGGYFGSIPGSRAFSGYDIVEFGRSYDEVIGALRRTSNRCRIGVVGFAEMTIDDVANACGMPLLEARLAKLREYDEPFRILPGRVKTARDVLFRALQSEGFGCRRGRCFDHVGAPVDLATSVRLVASLYRGIFGNSLTTIGFGVARDHAPLLRTVDRAFVLREADGPLCADLLQIRDTERVTEPGAAGWAATMTRLVGCGAVRRAP